MGRLACANPACLRSTSAEPLDGVAAQFAQGSSRLASLEQRLGLALVKAKLALGRASTFTLSTAGDIPAAFT